MTFIIAFPFSISILAKSSFQETLQLPNALKMYRITYGATTAEAKCREGEFVNPEEAT